MNSFLKFSIRTKPFVDFTIRMKGHCKHFVFLKDKFQTILKSDEIKDPVTIQPLLTYLHSVKSVQIWGFFWSIFSCIRTEYRKILTRKISVFGHFSRSVKIK